MQVQVQVQVGQVVRMSTVIQARGLVLDLVLEVELVAEMADLGPMVEIREVLLSLKGVLVAVTVPANVLSLVL